MCDKLQGSFLVGKMTMKDLKEDINDCWWYHGYLTTEQACLKLKTFNKKGSYLLRQSKVNDCIKYILSYSSDNDGAKILVNHLIVPELQDEAFKTLFESNPKLETTLDTAIYILDNSGLNLQYPVINFDGTTPEAPENTKQQNSLSCYICDTSASDDHDFNNHMKSHDISYCEKCTLVLTSDEVQDHVNKCNGGPQILKCEHCDYTTTNKVTLKKHKKEHIVHCNLCDDTFANADHLEIHLRTHTEYDCNQCGMLFKSTSAKNIHVRNVHGGDNYEVQQMDETAQKKPRLELSCPEPGCYLITQTAERLEQHIKKRHKKQTPKPETKYFKCEFCDYESTFKQNVQRHVRGKHSSNV